MNTQTKMTYTLDFDEADGYEERKRTIWTNGNFQSRGEYILNKEKDHATEQQYHDKNKTETNTQRN